MKVRKVTKPVYICSDGTEFSDQDAALEHQFTLDIDMGSDDEGLGMVNVERFRKVLKANKNTILDYLGTAYDPVAVDEENNNA